VISRTRSLNRLIVFQWMRIFGFVRELVTHESQILALPRATHGALFPVYLQPQFLFDKAAEASHHSTPCPFASDKDDTAIYLCHSIGQHHLAAGPSPAHNNHMHSDSKKRRSFLAMLFATGDVRRWGNNITP